MASLTDNQVRERIKSPKAASLLNEAIYHENRVRFHGEAYLSQEQCGKKNPYQAEYFKQVEGILDIPAKISIFKKLIRYPFPTQTIVERAQSYHTKVFKAKDAFVDYGFDDAEENADFGQYLAQINEPKLWQESGEGFQCRYERVSKLWVADLPSASKSQKRSEPYFYTVNIAAVVDIEIEAKKIGFLILRLPDPDADTKQVLALDADQWRILTKGKDDDDYKVTSFAYHGLGYAPAGFLVSTVLGENPLARFSPFSPVLGLLDRYLDKYTSKDHYELYAAFALYWMFKTSEAECEKHGCENGKRPLYDRENRPMMDGSVHLTYDCPSCKDKGFLGAGTVLKVPPPDGPDDADLRNPIGMVPADAGSLEFNQKEIERSKAEILDTITEHVEAVSREQMNEKQVTSNTDSESAVLYWLSTDMSAARKHLIDTLGKLRYGLNYKGSNVSFGTLFFDQDAAVVLKTYQGLKDAGVPQYLLLPALAQLKESLLWANDTEKAKAGMLEFLDPLPTVAVDKVLELFDRGWVNQDDAVIKLYFMDLINQFEAENGEIALFLTALPFENRLNVIKKTLKIYADGKASKIKPVTPQDGKGDPVAGNVR